MRILQRGDTGNDVRTAQTALIRAGYAPGRADGIFGSNTEDVVNLQRCRCMQTGEETEKKFIIRLNEHGNFAICMNGFRKYHLMYIIVDMLLRDQ